VNFDNTVKKQLLEIQERLRFLCTRGNFTRPENLHLTLAFLGETPEEKLSSLLQIINDTCPLSETLPIELAFTHTGCFTHSHKELWWVGAGESGPGLRRLRAIHGELLKRLLEEGFSVDRRPFNPHITLGREVRHLQPIDLKCNEIRVKVDRISLMKSEHIRGVLTYTELR
jgi:2'-5' RNA ligase